jgi:hypothetical protein
MKCYLRHLRGKKAHPWMGAQKCVTAEPHVSKIYIRQSLSKDWKLSGLGKNATCPIAEASPDSFQSFDSDCLI